MVEIDYSYVYMMQYASSQCDPSKSHWLVAWRRADSCTLYLHEWLV